MEIFAIPSSSTPTGKTREGEGETISIYDNSMETKENPLVPFIGILGGNARARAFEKRILASGYSNPILCDEHWKEKPNYVSWETFEKFAPTIILVTARLPFRFEEALTRFRSPMLLIDARETSDEKNSPITGAFRAFANLSNWEIEHGTHRVAVAIDAHSPDVLLEFIAELRCFPRGLHSPRTVSLRTFTRKTVRKLFFSAARRVDFFRFLLDRLADRIQKRIFSLTALLPSSQLDQCSD